MNLNQITVPVLNIEESILFYKKIGLRLIVKSPDYARFECPDGDATFSIHKVEKLSSGEGISVYFECENLDQYVKELVAKEVKFEELPNDKSWLWRESRLKDLDGNQLILFYGGDNRKNPPWRVNL